MLRLNSTFCPTYRQVGQTIVHALLLPPLRFLVQLIRRICTFVMGCFQRILDRQTPFLPTIYRCHVVQPKCLPFYRIAIRHDQQIPFDASRLDVKKYAMFFTSEGIPTLQPMEASFKWKCKQIDTIGMKFWMNRKELPFLKYNAHVDNSFQEYTISNGQTTCQVEMSEMQDHSLRIYLAFGLRRVWCFHYLTQENSDFY